MFEFAVASSQKNSKYYDYGPEEMISNKLYTAGTPWLSDNIYVNFDLHDQYGHLVPKCRIFPFKDRRL